MVVPAGVFVALIRSRPSEDPLRALAPRSRLGRVGDYMRNYRYFRLVSAFIAVGGLMFFVQQIVKL